MSQADHWKDWLEPELRAIGFEGVYKQKTRESMGQDGKMDGCAILYRKQRFSLVEKHALEFNHVAMSRAKQFKNEKALQVLEKLAPFPLNFFAPLFFLVSLWSRESFFEIWRWRVLPFAFAPCSQARAAASAIRARAL